MTRAPGLRSRLDEQARRSDALLDSLLAARARRLHAVVDQPLDARPHADGELRRTAELLDRHLVRFHPSYRFEEALAGRLRREARAAAKQARSAGEVVALEDRRPAASANDASHDAPRELLDRRILLGGAIASGVSLAGAALFAWRRARPATVAAARGRRRRFSAAARLARHAARQRVT